MTRDGSRFSGLPRGRSRRTLNPGQTPTHYLSGSSQPRPTANVADAFIEGTRANSD